jgi:hypothetical protein
MYSMYPIMYRHFWALPCRANKADKVRGKK